eukprot:758853-Hanusia_phi.AAC.3
MFLRHIDTLVVTVFWRMPQSSLSLLRISPVLCSSKKAMSCSTILEKSANLSLFTTRSPASVNTYARINVNRELIEKMTMILMNEEERSAPPSSLFTIAFTICLTVHRDIR